MKRSALKSIACATVALCAFVVFAGPEQDFDAAYKAGQPLTAEAAYRKIVQDGAKVNPIVHYRAAIIADTLGKTTMRDDRMQLFVRLEKGWTPEVEQVLWRLCVTSSDPELFHRLAQKVPASPELWSVGRGMESRLYDQRRPAELFKVADILMAKFIDADKRNDVLYYVAQIAPENFEKKIATFPKQAYRELVLRYPDLANKRWFVSNFDNSWSAQGFTRFDLLDYLVKFPLKGDEVGDWALRRAVCSVDFTPKTDEEKKERADAAKKINKLKDVIFDGKHPEAANHYLYYAIVRFPDLFVPNWKDGQEFPGAKQLWEKVIASEGYKKNRDLRNWADGRYHEMMSSRRFPEADVKAWEAKRKADDEKRRADEEARKKNPPPPTPAEQAFKTLREVKDNDDAILKAIDDAMKFATPKTEDWGDFERACQRVKDGAKRAQAWYRYRVQRGKIVDNYDCMYDISVPRGSEKPYEGVDLKKMSPWNLYQYAYRTWDNMKDCPARWQFFIDAMKSRPFAKHDPDFQSTIIYRCSEWFAIDKKLFANYPADEIMAELFQPKRIFNGRWDSYEYFLRVVPRLADPAAARKRYCDWADALPMLDRAYAYKLLFEGQYKWYDEKEKREGWTTIFSDADFIACVNERLVPFLKSVPKAQAGLLDFDYGRIWGRLSDYERTARYNNDEKTREKYAELSKGNVAFYDAMTEKLLEGARNKEGTGCEGRGWFRRLDAEMAAKADSMRTAAAARRAGLSIETSGHWIGWDNVRGFMDRYEKELTNLEALYLFADSVPGNSSDQNLVAKAAKLRASLASKLPGIYPVPENDPSYPLYVAADELARKNPERAWEIMREPKNQTIFEREALKFPPDFIVWTVEQLRMSRGEKDALLIKARNLATAILAQEAKVPTEVAAAMILSRAEGYRDQQNFEAAKLEYQSVRDNPAYHATKYGKKAMFRAVDLQIALGNVQAVESTLEYWLSQNDREIQTEAHYFQALIAFERKDYDECIKQLRQVFAINYTHTEGRFLQGKWKLATNSEVDDTDVLIGDLSERDMIRPGNQLTVTVQDSNLSVAGGGASIPVIVTAKPGGDVERINLYPTSRDPSNFKGLVEVKLGKANPTNRVLEVRGDDTVSYVIDPAFLKERGLPLNQPKNLRVIDDAKLSIGAGAPRTDEKKTEQGVKDLLNGGADLEDSGVVRKLRPGNPLYVVVQDRDCSFGGEKDAVRATIRTSSGDRLVDYPLVEEKPYSGIFRAKIETSLPPPRAFASDTAAGFNPGDAINETKTQGWKSLSDGQPGKWFSVDTMGSFQFSEIAVKSPTAADIKKIKLVGRMGSKVMTLGQLPAATEMSKVYLRRQQQYDRNTKSSLPIIRAFCQTDKAAKSYIVSNIEFRVKQNNDGWERQTALYSGPFLVPEGVDALRFRLVPRSNAKEALRELWVTFAIDGEEIFSGQGVKLQNALMGCDIAPGCHQFELAVVGCRRNDEFDFVYEPEGKEPQPFPGDWFDEEKHPVLKRFVKDRATIERTADGFVAKFDKPERLRTFTWEFADVKSPDIAITRVEAKDNSGNVVLPVKSDFSDSQNNKTLEVAPGDKITVAYTDERTTSGEKKVYQSQMDSSFTDAKVRFIFEAPNERGQLTAFDAFRFQPGDALVVAVEDTDCDVTSEADDVEVTVKNAAGKTFKKKLVEFQPQWHGRNEDEAYGMHSGIFMGVLKTCPAGDTNAPPNVLRVTPDDQLTVVYEDRENTDPGVPCARQARIFAARGATPQLTLFDVEKSQEVDTSRDAAARLERIRRRPGNENVKVLYRDVLTAKPMDAKVLEGTNAVPVNVSAGLIPVRFNDRSRARYACSSVTLEAVAESEVQRAEAEGREPDKITMPLRLAGSLAPFRLRGGSESAREAQASGSFNGVIHLSLGPIDPNIEVPENAPPILCVTGSDTIHLRILNEEGDQTVASRDLKLVSDARLGLTDSSFAAERNSAHVGESFFVMVDDADRDATDEPDQVDAVAISSQTGVKRPIKLTETMPHSGIFTGRLRPVMFAPGETIPSVATGGVASANEVLTEERFAVKYGDQVIFRYRDTETLPGTPARTLSVTGTVFRGSNGSVRLFSKRFADRDTAVLVQFRLAECLFEQAKEHRKLKQPEKSAEAIAEGKFILEEALKNYPDSSHVVQGEFLLANLYQELATEAKDAEDMDKAIPLYQEALSRFSQILGTWPDGEYAARSQYHKALCLEMLKDYQRAAEEYVKMTYLYPESELVGEATIRLATYYYTKEKRYDISGHIYKNFQQRFPQHEKAARSLFMAGSCYIKQSEALVEENEKRRAAKQSLIPGCDAKVRGFYAMAVKTFDTLVETYRESAPKLRAQTLYWAGDVSVRMGDHRKAYQYLKRCVFEFPETEWARRARGLLLQEGDAFKAFE